MIRGRVLLRGVETSVSPAPGGAITDAGEYLAESDVAWLPPLVPRTLFAVGLNYREHVTELRFAPGGPPLIFLKGGNTVGAHRSRTARPRGAAMMHYECELAVVVGRDARGVPAERALECVAGYTVANDYVVRDYLENYYRPNLRAKNRDGATLLGPWLVDAADVPDPHALALRTTVNGRETQRGSTGDMIHRIADLVAHLSAFMTLSPGDVILTGTPHGVVDVQPGDEVVTTVEGVGSLTSFVVDEAPLTHSPER